VNVGRPTFQKIEFPTLSLSSVDSVYLAGESLLKKIERNESLQASIVESSDVGSIIAKNSGTTGVIVIYSDG
jgi:hypothetical protein